MAGGAAAGAASAPSAAAARQHYSGLWIGEAHPAAGSEHDVPVNPIKWSLSLCSGWWGNACARAIRGVKCGRKTRHPAPSRPAGGVLLGGFAYAPRCAARARARARPSPPNSSPFAARLPCLPQEPGRYRRLAQAFLTMQVRDADLGWQTRLRRRNVLRPVVASRQAGIVGPSVVTRDASRVTLITMRMTSQHVRAFSVAGLAQVAQRRPQREAWPTRKAW